MVASSMKNMSTKRRIVHGALAGVMGTVVMTVPILASQRLHLLHTPPPVEISANVARGSCLTDLTAPFPSSGSALILAMARRAGSCTAWFADYCHVLDHWPGSCSGSVSGR